MTPPCHYCADRRVGCHTVCEKYKEWKAYIDKKKAIERTAKQGERAYREHCVQYAYKVRKNKHRR